MALNTPFDKSVTPIPDLGGQGIVSRGTDPNIDTGGTSGLTGVAFDKAIDPTMDAAESANSVSGLPSLPARFEPAESSVEIPSLEDRNPGTIDKR